VTGGGVSAEPAFASATSSLDEELLGAAALPFVALP
jgi:hypothetical protein